MRNARELLLAFVASGAVLAVLVGRPPGWETVAIVGAAALPASLILTGAALARQSRAQRGRRDALALEADRARADLQYRVAELVTLNELAIVLGSTLDLDELLERSLEAVVARLRFDRALILLVDAERGVLGAGRSTGGGADADRLVGELELSLEDTRSNLVRLALADGPMLFRDVDQDEYEPNRAFARAIGATSFLGTPLVTKGRAVGVLAVDNRLSGRDLERSAGPLLFTVGNLVGGAIETARLYGEVDAYSRELEARVAKRTEQLARAVEQAQDARAEAEAASETKSRFLAHASHELRTPLTSVIGFTKLIRKRLDEVIFPAIGEPTEPRLERAMRQVADNLEIMVTEGDRLTTLINEVLDLEKIRAGRMSFRSEPVDLDDVIARATAATASLFETSGLRLVQEVEGSLPPVVGDRDRLIQVVINLLSNAVKFTPRGSVTVRAAGSGGEVAVSVADTGNGIDPADQARVFEPFEQAGGTATSIAGTGLGLPICRQIVERHGGRLWVESRPGAGSTFSFALPVGVAVVAGSGAADEQAGAADVGP